MTFKSRSIFSEFVVLNAKKNAFVENCDSNLYSRLKQNHDSFAGCELISCHSFEHDWDTWEIHPNGDEIVILLSGQVTFVFKLNEGRETITLERLGDYTIVPKNTWHTAKTNQKSSALFITPGEGTENHNDPNSPSI